MIKSNLRKIDWSLVLIPILAIVMISYLLEQFPQSAHHILTSIRVFFNDQLTVIYILVGLFFFLSTLYVAFSKIGHKKLGNKDDHPEYSNLRWGVMIFTSTMSADIIFYALCEWMMYAQEPFIQSKGNVMEWSLTYSLFHWGPIAWSFYIMLAVAFAYMLFVTKNQRQKFSEACRPILGKYTDGILGKLIDLIAIFALLAGTATTFSMSMPLLSAVVGHLFHINSLTRLSLVLIIIVVLIYLIASVMGMKAISRLSAICYTFFIGLLLYVLLFSGNANFILDSGLQAVGNLTQNFIGMATTTRNHDFTQNWTIYYWSYWIIWCVATPFFIGSISKGRTIRDVVIRAYAWGLGGTFLAFIILGNFGMSCQIHHLINVSHLIASGNSYAHVALLIMKTLPQYRLALILLALAMIGLYSTVFDSITMVISKYSYRQLSLDEEPSKLLRGFWAIAFMILPTALLVSHSNMNNIQSVAIIAALPTMIVMILIVMSFYKEIRRNS
ncbi:BCCT family betaine carnitine choline transporter [Limosilactobacillus frumenti DSM 13145]|uniref:BCCT family betaine carnitine choline transporter n=1 Tax=Limosilactobacillus frumenti DSM 13145 TaxID=1423746 RepID=A0A0R1P110_9LACO|nr:BCCT family transporter [Limosilactobacillus frumenti]KRL26190.1 BCCT family betaine carnitine choline transporter [Limosilactobacillus frumenti DSM 13145]MBA2914633.1 BCCT family transporter [Limosilactobacillus frumenti]QFG72952.1 BCCT family transporter [Limosilactobacillus frumenti]